MRIYYDILYILWIENNSGEWLTKHETKTGHPVFDKATDLVNLGENWAENGLMVWTWVFRWVAPGHQTWFARKLDDL